MTQGEALAILKTGANVFLTGSPGSGKSHTVNTYVAWLKEHGIEPAITASTGIAATHIHGQTIHSWSGIGVAEHLSPELLDRVSSKEYIVKRIQKTPVLVIDEISMLSGTTLSMVDAVCREVRHSERPFGGMQVVLVGDFFQLPPIGRRGAQTHFAFESEAWRALNPIICYLSDQYRQEDSVLLDVLGAIRSGSWDHTHVSHITNRESEGVDIEDDVPRLYTHNEDVERLNAEKLAKLSTPSRTFAMSETGGPVLVEGLKRGCLSPETLVLKEGALVMCTKNNPILGYANGTLGRVVKFEAGTNYPVIETVAGDLITIAPADWAVEEDGRVRAKITQVPLRLAWAITIHKSQGMSMDQAAMDLSRVFEYGQGYVALSRVRSLAGLHLLGWSEAALTVHPEVVRVNAQLEKASEEARGAFAALSDTGELAEMEENFIRASGGTLEVQRIQKKSKASTYDETRDLVKEGKNVEEICTLRGRTLGTIADHLEKLIASNALTREEVLDAYPEDLRADLPKIFTAFKKKGSAQLAAVHTFLKGAHSYDDLKLARAVYSD
ncbi:MAG TPA: AAA family ATPase [Candidatus Paceibacterota bacterium]|nr:AAA family ATPase [Candidatus Paceibacterota bacterium]